VPTNQPNLLFIYTDQQRYNSLACYGNHFVHMPNLNRLADRSSVFEHAYCVQPVCTPSRSTILTGQMPHTNGVVNNNIDLKPETPCLPELLRAPFATAHFGKWHLGSEIYPQHGFQEWAGIDDTYYPFYPEGRDRLNDRSAYHHWLVQRGILPWTRNPNLPPDATYPMAGLTTCSHPKLAFDYPNRAPYDVNRFSREQITALPEEHCKPAFLADVAIDFLKRHQRERFCLYVNFFEPHHPNHSPRDNQYNGVDMQLPLNFHHLPDDSVPLGAGEFARHHLTHPFDGDPVSTPDDVRAYIARYWGMCSLVDTHVGRILATLDALNLTDNTIIFFTTDHGEMLGEHRCYGKGIMYEPSIRVPMMISLPGQRAHRMIRGRVSQLDIVPTLLDFLGQDIPPFLQGQSLRPELSTGQATRDVVSTWNPHPDHTGKKSEAVRTLLTQDGYKLTLSSHGKHELRYLPTDPLELGNLLHENPNHPKAPELRQRLATWQQHTNDTTCPALQSKL